MPQLILKLRYKLVLDASTDSTTPPQLMIESIGFPLRQCLILYKALLANHYTIPPSMRKGQRMEDCFKVSNDLTRDIIHTLHNYHTHHM